VSITKLQMEAVSIEAAQEFEKAEKQYNNQEKTKMNKQERIKQCKNDIAKLQESLKELKTETPIRHGDVVDCVCGRRIILCNSTGALVAYSRDGCIVGSGDLVNKNDLIFHDSWYKCTGKNIFTDNLLGLDD